MSARPKRKMPSLTKIVEYWEKRFPIDGLFLVDWGEPACFGCNRMAPAFSPRYFERAHLVDRCRDGLDLESNLVPLCGACHAVMPSFGPKDGAAAIEWVHKGGMVPLVIARAQAMGVTSDSSLEEMSAAVEDVIRDLENLAA